MKCVCVAGRGTRNGWTWSSRAADKGENICLYFCLNVTFLEALWHLNAPFLSWVPPLYLKCKIEAQIPPLLSDRLLCCWSRSVRTWLIWWGLRAWSARSEVCRLFCELRTFPNIRIKISPPSSHQVWILVPHCLPVSVCCQLRNRESHHLLVKMAER